MSDLASLLAANRQDAGDGVSFASGTVELYNHTTGENRIRIGGASGALLVNVPVLNSAIRLKLGETAALLRFKTSYFILGRVSVPGSSTFATGTTLGFCNQSASGFGVNGTAAVKVSDRIYGSPAWVTRAMLIVTGTVGAYNDSGAPGYLYATCRLDGETAGYTSMVGAQYGDYPSVSTHMAFPFFEFEHRDFAADPIQVELLAHTDGGNWGSSGNTAHLSAIAVFQD